MVTADWVKGREMKKSTIPGSAVDEEEEGDFEGVGWSRGGLAAGGAVGAAAGGTEAASEG